MLLGAIEVGAWSMADRRVNRVTLISHADNLGRTPEPK